MRTKTLLLLTMSLFATNVSAQGGGTSADSAAARRAAREAAANRPRTIAGINSVWIEELTQPELRDMIREGYTTVLIMTGGVEDNGPNLALNKHNLNNRLVGEAIARRLGKTLVAPLVTLEPGNAGAVQAGRAGPMVSQATYRALLFDMGNYLRSMGFTEVFYLGDSGGNTRGMQGAADSLTKMYGDSLPRVRFKHIAEYYNHTSHVQPFIQNTLGIPEQIRIGASTGSSGLHEELGIDATLAVIDPASIRFEQRVKAGEASINGVKFESLQWLQEIGRKIVELRTTVTVDAINAYRASSR